MGSHVVGSDGHVFELPVYRSIVAFDRPIKNDTQAQFGITA